MVTDWIPENVDSLPVPTVYKFNADDNDFCKENFRETEQWYKDSYEYYKLKKDQLDAIYDGIYS